MDALSLMSSRTPNTAVERRSLLHHVRCFGGRLKSSGLTVVLGVSAACVALTSSGFAESRLMTQRLVRGVDRPKIELSLIDGTFVDGALVAFDGATWTVLPRSALVDATTDTQVAINTTRVAAVVVAPRRDPTLSSGAIPLSLGVLRTPNNQRLPGKLVIQSGKPHWDHRWIGACPLELDRVASISFVGDRVTARSPLSDLVTMVNGDVIRGFVESIGEDILLSPIDDISAERTNTQSAQTELTATGGQQVGDATEPQTEPQTRPSPTNARKIALDRVASIALATTPSVISAGTDIWTNDGSVVAAEQLRFEEAKGWSFVLADPWLRGVRRSDTSDNASADPLGIVLDRTRFFALSSLPLQSVTTPDGAFRHSTRNTVTVGNGNARLLDCGTIEITGPSIVRFGIPQDESLRGQLTLFSTISLVRPTPTDARVRVTIRIGTTAPEIIELDSESPRKRVAINRVLDSASTIEIEVTDGGNGIAGDRVLVDRAFLWSENARGAGSNSRSEKVTDNVP